MAFFSQVGDASRCRPIDLIVLSLANGDHQNDQPIVDHLIDQSIADASQLDLVAIRHARELVGLDPWPGQAGFQFFRQLQPDRSVQAVEFLPRFQVELQQIVSCRSPRRAQ